jgi:hypothetical protein
MDLQPFFDAQGNERRCGSLETPDGFVSAFADYSSSVVPYDDSDIRKLLTDSNRVPARVTFGPRWILDQKSHGSCNGHLCAGLLQRMRWLRGIQDGMLLSGAFPYSLMNDGRDQGSILERGMKVICEKGCPPADLVTWDMIYPRLQPRNAIAEAAKHKGFNPLRTTDLQQVRTALAQQIPVGIAVHAGSKYSRVDSKGRVVGVDSGRGNHAVIADDLVLIDGEEYLDSPGSWGLSLGVQGRVLLPLDSIRQTMQYHVFYVLMSTVEEE